MQQDLWGLGGDTAQNSTPTSKSTVKGKLAAIETCSITGHAPGIRSLAGTTFCTNCHVLIYCPACTAAAKLPHINGATPILCSLHQAPLVIDGAIPLSCQLYGHSFEATTTPQMKQCTQCGIKGYCPVCTPLAPHQDAQPFLCTTHSAESRYTNG